MEHQQEVLATNKKKKLKEKLPGDFEHKNTF